MEADARMAGMVKLEGGENLKGAGDVDAVEGRPDFFLFFFIKDDMARLIHFF